MEIYYGVAAVTLLTGLMLFGMSLVVGRAHDRTGIHAPTMTGDPSLERAVRAHANTLEWIPIFLPSLWLFAIYWSPLWASLIGLVWIVGRVVYFNGYLSANARGRYPGFLIQALAGLTLTLGALARIAWLWLA